MPKVNTEAVEKAREDARHALKCVWPTRKLCRAAAAVERELA